MCLHEWYATPNNLLRGTSCPQCDKRNKTSFAEQAILFYIRQKYPDAVNRYHGELGCFELDVFVPSINVGIEYDGAYFHTDSKRDKRKYELCKEKGIYLYRVIESHQASCDNADKVIIRTKPIDYSSLDASIIELCNCLGCNMSIDTHRDSLKIREQYYGNIEKRSITSMYPHIAEEWLYSQNGTLRSILQLY